MASKGIVDDPLRGGGAFDDQDMEDLTSHLANLPVGRNSHDGFDLGDNSELLQGNLDRFRALAGDDSHDELFTSYGGLGLGLGVSDSTIITTTNYPTYGELAAAMPPSYEDSVMYEQAPPLNMHAASGAGGDMDPLSAGHESDTGLAVAARPGLGARVSEQQPPPAMATANGGPSWTGAGWAARGVPLGASEPAEATAAGAGPGVRHSGSSAAAASGPSAGGPLGPLALPGSGELRLDDIQSPSPHLFSPGGMYGMAPSPGHPGGGGSGNRAGGGGGLHQHFVITVTDPVKREHGGIFGIKGGYVTYLVRAKARGGSTRPETTVRRRFREFVALAQLLKEKYSGHFVPPRPEKNAMEGQRMTDAFVEERRIALERYLNKLARHPVIGASEELRLFLEVDGELADSGAWLALRPPNLGGSVLEGTAKFSKQILGLDRAVMDPVQASQPTKKANDFMRAIKETARSMQSAPSASSLPPDEMALVRAKEEVEALQGALTTASRSAEKLVARLDRWSVVYGELGLVLIQMRNAEKADGVALANHTGTLKQSGGLMHDTERLGTALVRSSRIGRKVTGRCAIELACLHEYLGLMPAALKGLRARDKALLTADTVQSDLEGRRKAIVDLEAAGAKVFGGDTAKAKKVAELNGDVAVLEQSVVAARARYDKIKEINHQEMSRLRCELRSDLMSMLHRYATIMSACSQRNLEIWLQAAAELQATPEQLQAAKACLVDSDVHQQQQPPLPQQPSDQQHQFAMQYSEVAAQPPYTTYGPASSARTRPGLGLGPGGWGMGEVDRNDVHQAQSYSSGADAGAGGPPGRDGYPL
ncbi:hypothetical protein Vretimale_14752 [Volvox reticuliferus]|uniref:PX domain-containing protein n=1 Tax=Volvox reticuliferus TaxID=1737510 RepID=A0A8J4LVL4_9CHLO|nr:hypothetical protein Vretifemale_15601 [Volvox reticuliferus]GIM11222.1 hypothetical protein Vretimale_14752 [Volvox reticuliferus]